MATKKTPNRSTETTQKIKTILKNETVIFGIGLILVIISMYMLLAFLSFFSHGPADQSVLDTTVVPDLTTPSEQVENNAGPIGARIANYLINECFGFGAFGIVVFLVLTGLTFMKVHRFHLTYWFFTCFVSMIWLSAFLGFISLFFSTDTFIYLGGMHGYNVSKFLVSQIGYPGVWLLLLTTLILFAICISRQTIVYIRKALQFKYLHRNTDHLNVDVELTSDTPEATSGTADEQPAETADNTSETISDEQENPEEKEEKKDGKMSKMAAFFHRFHKKKSPEVTETPVETAEEAGKIVAEQPQTEAAPQTVVAPQEEKPVVKEEPISNSIDLSDLKVETSKPAETAAFEVNAPKGEEIITAPATTAAAPKTPDFQVEAIKDEEPYFPHSTEPYNPRLDLPKYRFPDISLMKQYDNMEPTINMEEQKANKEKIIKTLESFGINICTIRATVGPTVTLYEITPEQGVHISKIRGLEDDIALSLSALGIRIIAPIPGKGTIGIEVPNSNPRIVSGQSIIGSKKFHDSTYELPIALGKTITNEVFMVDLCKMPHILVAGATGQGKSVGLNTIITSLLYKKHPSELKFVLVDPKKVEFSIYSVIEKHFLAKLPEEEDAIITDVTKVVQTMNSVGVEMDTRYDLLKTAHVRNIKEYNEKFISRQLNPEHGHKFMPYIVVIIDEFGDLIMTAGKEIELPIARIAQLARAVGIHMVIATQRPTTNIITGTIKANFPARIAFRVSAMMDSRTILDRPGANQLIGRGDMLFLQGADPVRVQCAFIDTPEVENITQFIASQPGYPSAFYLPEYVGEDKGNELGDVDMDRIDSLFEDAARLIVIHQQGSTSLIQRKFSIGYNRAGRIMDQLESAGIVGPAQGSKPREVLCVDEIDLEQRLNNVLK